MAKKTVKKFSISSSLPAKRGVIVGYVHSSKKSFAPRFVDGAFVFGVKYGETKVNNKVDYQHLIPIPSRDSFDNDICELKSDYRGNAFAVLFCLCFSASLWLVNPKLHPFLQVFSFKAFWSAVLLLNAAYFFVVCLSLKSVYKRLLKKREEYLTNLEEINRRILLKPYLDLLDKELESCKDDLTIVL